MSVVIQVSITLPGGQEILFKPQPDIGTLVITAPDGQQIAMPLGEFFKMCRAFAADAENYK